mgnify:CR=1 FL=1
MTSILGISAFYHDSAAAIIVDGNIIAAAQEERFSRKKHDPRYPFNAVIYVLSEGKLKLSEVDHIVFFEKPFLKFERLLETYLAFQLLRDTNCNRIIFLELNALTAAFFLLLLSLVDCFSTIFPMTNRIDDVTFMMCKLIPFCVSLILLVYQLTRILFNSGVVRREGNLFTIKIIGPKK